MKYIFEEFEKVSGRKSKYRVKLMSVVDVKRMKNHNEPVFGANIVNEIKISEVGVHKTCTRV